MRKPFSTFLRPGRVSSIFSRVLFFITLTSTLHAGEAPIVALSPHISQGGYALEINGKIVRSSNLDKRFIPASTIKVLTGLLALEILGPEYRFATRFYIDNRNVLYVKGEGDPFFTSEVIVEIAQRLKKVGINELSKIVLDDSAFALEGPPPGSANSHNPYDAHSGALVVNFNALPFLVTKNRQVLSGEKQTPHLPLMNEVAMKFRYGRHRVNVSAFPQSTNHSNIIRYTGELFVAIFKNQGIDVRGGYGHGKLPKPISPLFIYESEKTVTELVELCLYYSSNFIANQLYLSCGRRIFGFPATWEKANRAVNKYAHLRLQMDKNAFHMEDGSGLSKKNRISPAAMLTILKRFTPHYHLLKENHDAFVKSGTLTGVYSYVGYFEHNTNLAPFVLLLNQKRNNRKLILNLMKNEYYLLHQKQ